MLCGLYSSGLGAGLINGSHVWLLAAELSGQVAHTHTCACYQAV